MNIKKKCQKILLFLCILINFHSLHPFIPEENPVISPFTQAIHQRFYFATRLEFPINMLEEIKRECQNPLSLHYIENDLIPYEEIKAEQFMHDRTKECISKIEAEKSFQPLFDFWQEISGYKYLNDKQIVNDFIRLIKLFCRKIVLAFVPLNKEQHQIFEEAFEKALTLKKPTKIDFIIACVELYYFEKINKKLDEKEFNSLFTQEKKKFTPPRITRNSDKIFERFYCIKRLNKPVEKLLNFKSKDLIFESNPDSHYSSNTDFKNDRIKSIIEQIETYRSTEPIKRAWQEFRTLKSLEDDQYLREILKMLFIAYKNILTKKIPKSSRANAQESLNTIEYLYNGIEEMETDHILNAIDLLTIELETIMAYEQTTCLSRLKEIKRSRFFWAGVSFISAVALMYIPKILPSLKANFKTHRG